METHNEVPDFSTTSNFRIENLPNQQLPIPPRVHHSTPPRNQSLTFNQPPFYQTPYPSYYGGGNYASNFYNGEYGNHCNTNLVNSIMESFSSINSVVQTCNALNSLVNTTYGAFNNSISTIANTTEQIHRTRERLLQIINSLNVFKIIKKFLLYIKRIIYYGELPKLEDLTSMIKEIKNWFKTILPKSTNDVVPYLFFATIVCGQIVIYQFIKSIALTKPVWNSQNGKSYVAKAKCDYLPMHSDELTLSQGEVVTIAPPEFQKNVNWYLVGNLKGEQGLVPANYLNVLGILDKKKNSEK